MAYTFIFFACLWSLLIFNFLFCFVFEDHKEFLIPFLCNITISFTWLIVSFATNNILNLIRFDYFNAICFLFVLSSLSSFFQTFCCCCSSTVVSIFPPPLPSYPSHPHSPPLTLTLFGFVHVSFIHVPENPTSFSSHYPLPPPLWLQSVCSQFQCLWLYFACLFVLLIR